jgi:hypothetical protein
VNGISTPNLDEFLKVILSLRKDQRTVRLRVLGLEDKKKTVTYKMDEEYWPIVVLQRDKQIGWTVKTIKR